MAARANTSPKWRKATHQGSPVDILVGPGGETLGGVRLYSKSPREYHAAVVDGPVAFRPTKREAKKWLEGAVREWGTMEGGAMIDERGMLVRPEENPSGVADYILKGVYHGVSRTGALRWMVSPTVERKVYDVTLAEAKKRAKEELGRDFERVAIFAMDPYGNAAKRVATVNTSKEYQADREEVFRRMGNPRNPVNDHAFAVFDIEAGEPLGGNTAASRFVFWGVGDREDLLRQALEAAERVREAGYVKGPIEVREVVDVDRQPWQWKPIRRNNPDPFPGRKGTGQRFDECVEEMKDRKGVYDPEGLCAYIGRKKYGKKGMAKMARRGRKRSNPMARRNPTKRWEVQTFEGTDVADFAQYPAAKRYAERHAYDYGGGLVVVDTHTGLIDTGDGWYDQSGNRVPSPRRRSRNPRVRRLRNLEGYTDDSGQFRPIRASADYDPDDVDEPDHWTGIKRQGGKAIRKRPAANKRVAKRYGVYVGDNLAYVSLNKDDAAKAAKKLRADGRKSVRRKMVGPNPVSGKVPKAGWRQQYKKAARVRVKSNPQGQGRGLARPNPPRGVADPTAAHELYLYATSTSELYPQRQAIEANLAKKMAKGSYSSAKAVKAWKYWMDNAAKRYVSEFGGDWSSMFNVPTRLAAAKEMADYFEGEARVQGVSNPRRAANRGKTMTPSRARRLLQDLGLNSYDDPDTIHPSTLVDLADQAKQYGYRKPSSASGSTGRYFFRYLKRKAAQANPRTKPNPKRKANARRKSAPKGRKGYVVKVGDQVAWAGRLKKDAQKAMTKLMDAGRSTIQGFEIANLDQIKKGWRAAFR